MTEQAARLKAAEAMIARLRDQLMAAHETIERLHNEIELAHRLINEGSATTYHPDNYCALCGMPWRSCECD